MKAILEKIDTKAVLEDVEWLLSVILSVCCCMGMFLIGVFAGNLFFGTLTGKAMAILFVVSLFLTWGLTELKAEVRYRRLLMMAQEENDKQDDQDRERCEHHVV